MKFPVSAAKLALIAVAAAMLAQCNFDPAAQAAAAAEPAVAGPDALASALKTPPRDGIIRLLPGDYGALEIDRTSAGKRLTLVSADPANPARFEAIVIREASYFTVRDIIVKRTASLPKIDYLVSITGSGNVRMQGLRIVGAGGDDRGRQYGIWIRSSHDVRIEGSSVTDTRYGLGMLSSKQVEIVGNEFTGLQTDGIRGGGIDELLIAENVLGRFTPAKGEHPDGIQLWSTNQPPHSRRITIRDNLVARDGGGIIQGIFVRDTLGKMPFEDVTVHGNLTIGTMYNGISVAGVTRGQITANEVVAYPDMKSWIRLKRGTDVSLTDNRAMQFVLEDNKHVASRDNQTTSVRPVGELRAVAPWLRVRPGLARRAGPYLRRLSSVSEAK